MYLLAICDNSAVLNVMLIIKTIIMIISVVVPIILMLSLMINIVKELMNGDPELLNKIKASATKKMIATIVIFMIPTFVNVLTKLSPGNSEYRTCFSSATPEYIAQRKSEEEAMQKINDERLAEYNKKVAEEAARAEAERVKKNAQGATYGGSSNYESTGDYRTWKQCDKNWGSNRMGSTQTICGAGCTSTSVAIALAKSGVRLNIPILNPATFVNWMNNNGGYSGNLLCWNVVTNLAPNFKYQGQTSLTGSKSHKAEQLRQALNRGEYVIAYVKGGGHWVFVDRVEGDNVYIIDPGANITNLFDYSGVDGYASYKIS